MPSITLKQPGKARALRFDPSKDGLSRWLGRSLSTIMHVVWQLDDWSTAKQVQRQIPPGIGRAYTTVTTSLGRLIDAGLVERKYENGRHVYRATESEQAFYDRQYRAILDSLGADAVADYYRTYVF